MTATKTKAVPTPAEARQQLHDARQAVDDLRGRVANGDTKVTPAQITKAHEQVEHLELAVDFADQVADSRGERDRVEAINSTVARVTSGDINANARALVDAETKAAEALDALLTAARDYADAIDGAHRQLQNLGDLPDHVEVSQHRTHLGIFRIHGATLLVGREAVGGALSGALYRALGPRHGELDKKSKDIYDIAATQTFGRPTDSHKPSAGQYLAKALARLAGTDGKAAA